MANLRQVSSMMMKSKSNPDGNLAFEAPTHGAAGSLLHRLNVKRLVVMLNGKKVALPTESSASVAMVTAELTYRLQRQGSNMKCIGLMLPGDIELDMHDAITDVIRGHEELSAILAPEDSTGQPAPQSPGGPSPSSTDVPLRAEAKGNPTPQLGTAPQGEAVAVQSTVQRNGPISPRGAKAAAAAPKPVPVAPAAAGVKQSAPDTALVEEEEFYAPPVPSAAVRPKDPLSASGPVAASASPPLLHRAAKAVAASPSSPRVVAAAEAAAAAAAAATTTTTTTSKQVQRAREPGTGTEGAPPASSSSGAPFPPAVAPSKQLQGAVSSNDGENGNGTPFSSAKLTVRALQQSPQQKKQQQQPAHEQPSPPSSPHSASKRSATTPPPPKGDPSSAAAAAGDVDVAPLNQPPSPRRGAKQSSSVTNGSAADLPPSSPPSSPSSPSSPRSGAKATSLDAAAAAGLRSQQPSGGGAVAAAPKGGEATGAKKLKAAKTAKTTAASVAPSAAAAAPKSAKPAAAPAAVVFSPETASPKPGAPTTSSAKAVSTPSSSSSSSLAVVAAPEVAESKSASTPSLLSSASPPSSPPSSPSSPSFPSSSSVQRKKTAKSMKASAAAVASSPVSVLPSSPPGSQKKQQQPLQPTAQKKKTALSPSTLSTLPTSSPGSKKTANTNSNGHQSSLDALSSAGATSATMDSGSSSSGAVASPATHPQAIAEAKIPSSSSSSSSSKKTVPAANNTKKMKKKSSSATSKRSAGGGGNGNDDYLPGSPGVGTSSQAEELQQAQANEQQQRQRQQQQQQQHHQKEEAEAEAERKTQLAAWWANKKTQYAQRVKAASNATAAATATSSSSSSSSSRSDGPGGGLVRGESSDAAAAELVTVRAEAARWFVLNAQIPSSFEGEAGQGGGDGGGGGHYSMESMAQANQVRAALHSLVTAQQSLTARVTHHANISGGTALRRKNSTLFATSSSPPPMHYSSQAHTLASKNDGTDDGDEDLAAWLDSRMGLTFSTMDASPRKNVANNIFPSPPPPPSFLGVSPMLPLLSSTTSSPSVWLSHQRCSHPPAHELRAKLLPLSTTSSFSSNPANAAARAAANGPHAYSKPPARGGGGLGEMRERLREIYC